MNLMPCIKLCFELAHHARTSICILTWKKWVSGQCHGAVIRDLAKKTVETCGKAVKVVTPMLDNQVSCVAFG